jgi:hypothetical protein
VAAAAQRFRGTAGPIRAGGNDHANHRNASATPGADVAETGSHSRIFRVNCRPMPMWPTTAFLPIRSADWWRSLVGRTRAGIFTRRSTTMRRAWERCWRTLRSCMRWRSRRGKPASPVTACACCGLAIDNNHTERSLRGIAGAGTTGCSWAAAGRQDNGDSAQLCGLVRDGAGRSV